MELNEFLEVSILFGYYKNLLSDKQKEYMEKHFELDYSLSEIAKEYEVPIIWIMFETPLDECIRRAVATNQEDLIEPLKRMEEQRKESSLYLINKYSGIDGPLYGNCRQLIDFNVSLMNGMPHISISCEYRTDYDCSIRYDDKTTSLIRIQY